jgi:DNA-binding NtrC family response regulator
MSAHVWVVDDDPNTLRYMQTLLQMEACSVHTASSGNEILDHVEQGLSPDLVFLDVMMPGMDGLHTLERLRKIKPGLKVVMLSCVKDTPKIVKAIRLGAEDYVHKPLDGASLQDLLQRYLPVSEDVGSQPAEEFEELQGDLFFVAASAEMRKIRSRLIQVARIDTPVLLLGESGVGKEVAAYLIHKHSTRSNRTFLKVNCAAIPADLIESELFGYEAGAFTGATRAKPGKFELCNGGTILLDEIGEMPPALQAKLLQVLQEQRFFRLGSRSTISVDVRILAATNIKVEEAIKKGTLRLDLYYRLSAFSIELPPLRRRKKDIPVLIKHFMKRMAASTSTTGLAINDDVLKACLGYAWPGNVRELHNFVQRYLVLGETAMPNEARGLKSVTPRISVTPEDGRDLKELVKALKRDAEGQVITTTLQQTNWNRRDAAALLNISYKALIYKMRDYGIEPRHEGPEGESKFKIGEEADLLAKN